VRNQIRDETEAIPMEKLHIFSCNVDILQKIEDSELS
jgi:hypothetical protein